MTLSPHVSAPRPRIANEWLTEVATDEAEQFQFVAINATVDIWDNTVGEPEAGPALLYLMRRFGPTIWGSEPNKDICAYVLTTPDPDILVNITVSHVLSYGLLARGDLRQECSAVHPMDLKAQTAVRLQRALRATLENLKIPVQVRSVPISVHGTVPYASQGLFNRETCVPAFEGRGRGVPEDWWKAAEDSHKN